MKHAKFAITSTIVLVGWAIGAAAAFAAPIPFDWAVRARSTLATGGVPISVVDQTVFDGATSVVVSDSFTDNPSGRDFALDGSANLSTGKLRVRNQGAGGPGGSQTSTPTFLFSEFLDTFTFHGDYTSTPLQLPFTATYDGTWTASLLSAPAEIFTWLWFADSTLSFTQDDWLDTATLFFSGGEIDKHLDAITPTTDGTQPIHVVYSGTLALSGVDPILRAWMGLEVDVNNANATGSWDADLAQTATLSFDFTGLDVKSASGVFPGAQSVPEPATLALLGIGVAGLVALRRRKLT